ncbi:hypothetical protein OGAPHI_003836 [Ogataea philodendri]|uniref:Uncharacterized protein n=1 Tax=Ogataea philodendri TaxID=1378263 RepID=A0A9P8P4J1_9ASCO|nr:uncharacterized protein OGAPHI_003836 [Ogataea philodendri]KAH3665648.1 hypothetical protein OGAPHI_003836 [Ogataea philodendri]
MNYLLLGILLSISGNLLISISINIQKQAHLNLGSQHYARNLKWQFGFILMTLGEVGNFVSYGLTPVSIVAPLGVVTIISNSTFIAPVLFHETIRARDLAGTFLSAAGVVLMILASVNDNQPPPITDSFAYIDAIVLSKPSLIYLASTAAIIFFLVIELRNLQRSIKYILLHLSLVAIFGTYTAISTKLLSLVVEFNPITKTLLNWRPYVLLVVITVTSAVQIHYLNSCLKIANATTVVPIHFVFFTTAVMSCSIVVFNDFADKSPGQCLVFAGGALLTFSGVFFICGGKATNVDQEQQTPFDPETEPLQAPCSSEQSSIVSSDEELPNNRHLIQTSKSTPELNRAASPGVFKPSYSSNNVANRHNSFLEVTRPTHTIETRNFRDLGYGYFVLSGGGALLNAIINDPSETVESQNLV